MNLSKVDFKLTQRCKYYFVIDSKSPYNVWIDYLIQRLTIFYLYWEAYRNKWQQVNPMSPPGLRNFYILLFVDEPFPAKHRKSTFSFFIYIFFKIQQWYIFLNFFTKKLYVLRQFLDIIRKTSEFIDMGNTDENNTNLGKLPWFPKYYKWKKYKVNINIWITNFIK